MRTPGVGGEVLERRRLGGGRGDDDRVRQGSVLGEGCDRLRDRRALLADRDIDAFHAGAALVDDRVDGDRRLAGLAVADDELTLPAADRRHGVDDLDPRLQRLRNRLSRHDARRLDLESAFHGGAERPLPVDRLPERVHDATEQRVAHRHRKDAAGRAHHLSLVEPFHRPEHDGADRLLVEVEGKADGAVLELQQSR